MTPLLTVILPTYNPHAERLARTLRALRAQTLPADRWETLVIDNASTRFPAAAFLASHGPANLRVAREPAPGLTRARKHGFHAARADAAVLVDDDNVLAPDYLERALAHLAAHPRTGTLGGPVVPEFAVEPPAWTAEFHGLLALRDLGPRPIFSAGPRPDGAAGNIYPLHAPVGAGMVIRRAAWEAWRRRLDAASAHTAPTDRRGADLSSGGDNDIVMASLTAGWESAYFPDLRLTHLIPAERLQPAYLARLNRGIQRSWVRVLARHDACPWPPIARWTLPVRSARAWLRHRAWRSAAGRIRWQGAVGHFEGRVAEPCPKN